MIGETFAYGCISTQIMLLFAIILFYTNLYSGAYFGRRRLYSPLFFPNLRGGGKKGGAKAGDSTLQSTVEDCNDETELPNASGVGSPLKKIIQRMNPHILNSKNILLFFLILPLRCMRMLKNLS